MATRRNIGLEKTLLEKDNTNPREEKAVITPAVPFHIIIKLLSFTFAMIVAPISIYFLTLNNVFSGNATFAGATAAISANVVLVAYVVVAMREDQSEAVALAEKEKKGR